MKLFHNTIEVQVTWAVAPSSNRMIGIQEPTECISFVGGHTDIWGSPWRTSGKLVFLFSEMCVFTHFKFKSEASISKSLWDSCQQLTTTHYDARHCCISLDNPLLSSMNVSIKVTGHRTSEKQRGTGVGDPFGSVLSSILWHIMWQILHNILK